MDNVHKPTDPECLTLSPEHIRFYESIDYSCILQCRLTQELCSLCSINRHRKQEVLRCLLRLREALKYEVEV
jgi:hypothetical protein